jgi:hypothetical protein
VGQVARRGREGRGGTPACAAGRAGRGRRSSSGRGSGGANCGAAVRGGARERAARGAAAGGLEARAGREHLEKSGSAPASPRVVRPRRCRSGSSATCVHKGRERGGQAGREAAGDGQQREATVAAGGAGRGRGGGGPGGRREGACLVRAVVEPRSHVLRHQAARGGARARVGAPRAPRAVPDFGMAFRFCARPPPASTLTLVQQGPEGWP